MTLVRAYLRLVARPIFKLGSAAHGLPPVVDHLLAGPAGTPAGRATAERTGAEVSAGSGRALPAGSPASCPAPGRPGPAGVRVQVCVCARVCARVCVRVRAGAREPPACPPLALRAVPAPSSRASLARSFASALLPPPSLLNLRVFFFFFLVSDSLPFIAPRSPSDTHTHVHTLRDAIVTFHLQKATIKEAEPTRGPAGAQQTPRVAGPAPAHGGT